MIQPDLEYAQDIIYRLEDRNRLTSEEFNQLKRAREIVRQYKKLNRLILPPHDKNGDCSPSQVGNPTVVSSDDRPLEDTITA